MKSTEDELLHRFSHHPSPNQARVEDYEAVSRLCFALAKDLNELCPAGRNHSLMLTHLEDVRMRANAAFACDSL
jgi:hypothetical protein